MSVNLPTATDQTHTWEGGILPTPRMCPVPVLPPKRDYWLEEGPEEARRAASGKDRLFVLRQACLLVWILAFSTLGYYLISHYVVAVVEVQGRSMAPTLQDGERYFLNRLAFYFRAPTRGDLVVVRDPGHEDCAVKRVIGVPGDSMQIRDGSVYVNGGKLAEPYLLRGTKTLTNDSRHKSVMLARDHYFLLGDNRLNSEDSRFYGPISRSQIVGLISQ